MDVEADIINPCLQRSCRVGFDQRFQWSVEDELGDGWGLRTSLKNAFVIAPSVSIDPFRLQSPGARVQVQGKLEVQRGIGQIPGRFNDLVQVHVIIEASEISEAGDRVDTLMSSNFSM